jgi:hypothetical protein
VTSYDRLHLAWSADEARLKGLPGRAERIEQGLSRAMEADYREWVERRDNAWLAKIRAELLGRQ